MFDLDLESVTNYIPLPLFSIEVTWFRGEGTSLISDVHIICNYSAISARNNSYADGVRIGQITSMTKYDGIVCLRS